MRYSHLLVLVVLPFFLVAGRPAVGWGQHRLLDTSDTAKQPGRLHSVCVYDTLSEDEPQEIYSKEYIAAIRHEPQYRLLVKRKQQIAVWSKKYAWAGLQNGTIIDERTFSTPSGNRTIVARMKCMVYAVHENEYSCPDVTNGCGYFKGMLFFSLLDVGRHKLINTIPVCYEDTWREGDTVFNHIRIQVVYPFSIANPKKQSKIGGLIYEVIGGTDSTDGEADIMHMRDINGDGRAYEFGLYSQTSCMGKESTLIAYNAAKDSLYWCSWDMTAMFTKDGKDYIENARTHWVDNAVAFQFDKQGRMRFDIDYRGRGGALMRYTFAYDRASDSYSGIADGREQVEDSAIRPRYYDQPVQR